MASRKIDLPNDESAVINDDPLQMHMDRLVELRLLSQKDDSVMAKISAAAVVAYTDSWTIKDDAGEIVPLVEDQVRARVRSSKITALYEAIDTFIAESAPKVPNARTPHRKR